MTNTTNNILDINNFGENLRRIRIEKGFTIEDFAFEIGKSARLIYDYENGLKFPKLETLIVIATVLEVTLDSILRSA